MAPDFFYCGFCEGSFLTNCFTKFQKHMAVFHHNKNHPESSHYIHYKKSHALSKLMNKIRFFSKGSQPSNILEQIINSLDDRLECNICHKIYNYEELARHYTYPGYCSKLFVRNKMYIKVCYQRKTYHYIPIELPNKYMEQMI